MLIEGSKIFLAITQYPVGSISSVSIIGRHKFGPKIITVKTMTSVSSYCNLYKCSPGSETKKVCSRMDFLLWFKDHCIAILRVNSR